MPCLIAAIASLFPRLTIVLLVIFSDYLGRAYDTTLWPLLGFFFMPYTTLAFAFGINHHGSIEGLYLALVIFTALVDFGVIGGSGSSTRRMRKVQAKRMK